MKLTGVIFMDDSLDDIISIYLSWSNRDYYMDVYSEDIDGTAISILTIQEGVISLHNGHTIDNGLVIHNFDN